MFVTGATGFIGSAVRLRGLMEHRIRSERSFHLVTRRAPLSHPAN
ncbi:hypothetical protein [Lichenicoccus sp.]